MSEYMLATGDVDKDKINIFSGRFTPPLWEAINVMTNGDRECFDRAVRILVSLFSNGQEQEMMELLRLLYDLSGLIYPREIDEIAGSPKARNYYLFCFLLDTQDVMEEEH